MKDLDLLHYDQTMEGVAQNLGLASVDILRPIRVAS